MTLPIIALIFIGLILAGGGLLASISSTPSLDRDLPRGCVGMLLAAVGAVGLFACGVIALVGAAL